MNRAIITLAVVLLMVNCVHADTRPAGAQDATHGEQSAAQESGVARLPVAVTEGEGQRHRKRARGAYNAVLRRSSRSRGRVVLDGHHRLQPDLG